jgi:hypothetical protein
MTKPTKEEMDKWMRDREFLRLANIFARDDIPEAVRDFCRDINTVIHFLASEGELSRPTHAIFRIVRRLGQSACPELSRPEQRRYGLMIIRRILPRRPKTPMFRLSVTQEWKKLRKRKMREYHERCLESGFIMRVHELSKPGGVSDRIELFQQGKLPRFLVERDLALPNPGNMSRGAALTRAAEEIADQARKWFGKVPRQWRPINPTSLGRRYRKLLDRYVAQGYFDREGGMLQEPLISLETLIVGPGRPAGK